MVRFWAVFILSFGIFYIGIGSLAKAQEVKPKQNSVTKPSSAPEASPVAVPAPKPVVAPASSPAPAPTVAVSPAATTDGKLVPSAPASTAESSALSEQGFNLKLRDIEERVNELKEKVFASKARLIQLQEVVLHGTVSGARAILIHQNEMGSTFKLRRVQYSLDGAPIFNQVDSEDQGSLDQLNEMEVFNGHIAPGSHQLSVYLEYQGYGYGVFSYLKGYRFKIKSSFTFNADEGKETKVRIVGFEKNGVTLQLQDRPTVRYDLESTQVVRPTVAEGSGSRETPASEAAPR